MGKARIGKYWRFAVPALLLAMGAVLGVSVALVRQGGSSGGSSPPTPSEVCARGPQGQQFGAVGSEQFDKAEAGMNNVLTLTGQGNVDAAYDAFFLDVHSFTHALDTPLRPRDPELATKLCRAVVQIESDFQFKSDAATVSQHATAILEMIKQARTEVGDQP